MSRPVIITCAPTGGIHTPTMSPHLPVTPDEIAGASIEAVEAGAAIVHLHARDPETGRPDPRPELFHELMAKIAGAWDAVMNVSTGSGLGMTREERLRAAVSTSPEMASLNVGSLNFGIFPMAQKQSAWKHAWEPEFLEMTRDFDRPPPDVLRDPCGLPGRQPAGRMEDSLFIGPGELTPSNAAQVRKIRGIVEALGHSVATPAEARRRLALKGADRVTV